MRQTNIQSIMVGGTESGAGEYPISAIVQELTSCCALGLLPPAGRDWLYGVSGDTTRPDMMRVYKNLVPHLEELWLLVGKTQSLPLAVETTHRRWWGRSTGIDWDQVQYYQVLRGTRWGWANVEAEALGLQPQRDVPSVGFSTENYDAACEEFKLLTN